MKIINEQIPTSLLDLIEDVNKNFSNDKVKQILETSLLNSYQTTFDYDGDETFVVTGDIPAMWNRDSVCQIRPFLYLIDKDEEIRNIVKGIIQIQKRQISVDPYANAFNKVEGTAPHAHEEHMCDALPLDWERKYEIDSLCYPIQLMYFYYKITGDQSIFDDKCYETLESIINVFEIEQNHFEKSTYRFNRLNHYWRGNNVTYTGLTWGGHRPSDDECIFGYLIPANMFVVVVMDYLIEIINTTGLFKELESRVKALRESVDKGIQEHGIVEVEGFGKVFAYEVDGFGNRILMDDANVPSLLSAPYLGYCAYDNEVYLNTRKYILSKKNPAYFEGTQAKGIGSPHTKHGFVWHIALSMQGLTSLNEVEKSEILQTLITTDADTNLMHESFNPDNHFDFTREWFGWSNSLFAEFVFSLCNIKLEDKFKH